MGNNTSVDFISSYIRVAASAGSSSPDEICEFARKEIASIDEELNKAEQLRVRRENIKKVLKYYGVSITPPQKVSSDEVGEFAKKIVEAISGAAPMTNRELMQKLGYGTDVLVIKGLKLLTEKLVIERDKSADNRILKGPNFDEYKSNNQV